MQSVDGGGYVGTLVLNLLFLCAVSRHLPPPFLPNSISVSGSSASPHLAVGVQPGDLFAPNEQHHKLVLVYNWQTHELAKIYDGGKEGFFLLDVTSFLMHSTLSQLQVVEGWMSASILSFLQMDSEFPSVPLR